MVATGSNWELYDALVEEASVDGVIEQVILGISWSLARVSVGETPSTAGFCFSPQHSARTLPWSGSLVGRSVSDVVDWVRDWEGAAATVGVSVINSVINQRSTLLTQSHVLEVDAPKHLVVFHHFRPQLRDRNVVVIGRYPGLEPFAEAKSWHCIERNPQAGDLPDAAASYLLPQADWVFITGSSIANKTLPQLLSLSRHANVVLMGPSVPWSHSWKHFGVRYVAGVEVFSEAGATDVVSQAGGTRLFELACRYRLVDLEGVNG